MLCTVHVETMKGLFKMSGIFNGFELMRYLGANHSEANKATRCVFLMLSRNFEPLI